jgi:NADH:ubiquinone oxidoreductase subunit
MSKEKLGCKKWIKNLTDISVSNDYLKAREEWIQIDVGGEGYIRSENKCKCICEKDIGNLFTIVNKQTGEMFFCGSTCVKKIGIKSLRSYKGNKKYHFKKFYKQIHSKIYEKNKFIFENNDEYKKMVAEEFTKCYFDLIRKAYNRQQLEVIYNELAELTKIYQNKEVFDKIVIYLNQRNRDINFQQEQHERERKEEEEEEEEEEKYNETEKFKEYIMDLFYNHRKGFSIDKTINLIQKTLDEKKSKFDENVLLELIKYGNEKKKTLNKLHEKGF